MEIRPATRTGVKPLVGLYSESGCGKTMSGLLLARGLVGSSGKIVMVDTESGRGELYADVIPGGYDVLPLREPFSPERYIEAVQTVEKSGAQVGVLDSASHEWEGLGGVLDQASQNEAKNGKSLNNWRLPKMDHAKFMLKLLQSPIPWIVCLRAKYKTKQVKNPNGKSEVAKDDYTTPIQADDFIFEMTCHGEIMPDHTFRLTKCSHPALRKCMPNNELTTIEHGQQLAQWCAAPSNGGTTIHADPVKAAMAELWGLLKPVRTSTDKTWGSAEVWLVAHDCIADTEEIKGMPVERLREVLTASKAAMAKQEEAPV